MDAYWLQYSIICIAVGGVLIPVIMATCLLCIKLIKLLWKSNNNGIQTHTEQEHFEMVCLEGQPIGNEIDVVCEFNGIPTLDPVHALLS